MYGFYECDSTVMDAKQLPSQHAEPSCYSYEKPFLNNVSREYSQTFGHHFHQSQMPQYSSQGITDHPGFYPNEFAFERLLSESKKPVHNNKDGAGCPEMTGLIVGAHNVGPSFIEK